MSLSGRCATMALNLSHCVEIYWIVLLFRFDAFFSSLSTSVFFTSSHSPSFLSSHVCVVFAVGSSSALCFLLFSFVCSFVLILLVLFGLLLFAALSIWRVKRFQFSAQSRRISCVCVCVRKNIVKWYMQPNIVSCSLLFVLSFFSFSFLFLCSYSSFFLEGNNVIWLRSMCESWQWLMQQHRKKAHWRERKAAKWFLLVEMNTTIVMLTKKTLNLVVLKKGAA